MRQARPALYWAGGSRTGLALFAIILCCAVLAFRVSEPYPLSHAHWDSAVYLLDALIEVALIIGWLRYFIVERRAGLPSPPTMPPRATGCILIY